jgi:hypothetical protein
MREAFHLGGWGMWPTLVCGIIFIAASIRYALRPEERWRPLLGVLGLLTFIVGVLGFVTGVIHSIQYMEQVKPDERFLVIIGFGESLYNVSLSLVLIVLGGIAMSIGAWRNARAASEAGKS